MSPSIHTASIRPATPADIDALSDIRGSVRENPLSREHGSIWLVTDGGEGIRANDFYRRHGWQLAGRVDERDVRYEKNRG